MLLLLLLLLHGHRLLLLLLSSAIDTLLLLAAGSANSGLPDGKHTSLLLPASQLGHPHRQAGNHRSCCAGWCSFVPHCLLGCCVPVRQGRPVQCTGMPPNASSAGCMSTGHPAGSLRSKWRQQGGAGCCRALLPLQARSPPDRPMISSQ